MILSRSAVDVFATANGSARTRIVTWVRLYTQCSFCCSRILCFDHERHHRSVLSLRRTVPDQTGWTERTWGAAYHIWQGLWFRLPQLFAQHAN